MNKRNLFSISKTLLVVMLMWIGIVPINAQDRNNEEEVVKIDARRARFDYCQGELIVKFKDSSAVQVKRSNGKFRSTSVKAIDDVMLELGGFEMEALMPHTGKNVARRAAKSITGEPIKDFDLSKLYRVKFNGDKIKSVEDAVAKFKAMDDVEFAEPNYRVYAMVADSATYTVEPLYKQQHGIATINLPALWNAPKITNKRPIIAILDTGVEITHPDLASNIWVNEAELNGAEAVDDDGNGYVDDIYGWDFINQTGELDDYNGHGTHCAGIAAAVGNNGIGIVGANPDALIMPISIMQSNGTGDVATIIKGLDYASSNGADVISMSFGSYSTSIAYELALGKAYQKAVLVAAAGNDGMTIEKKTSFPAAYSFVLGIQASDGGQFATFSNLDTDGPTFSSYPESQLYNYELTAPGVGIMSTFPGGQYKSLNGTSMACPLVAGAISRLLQCKEYLSKEMLWGDLIHASTFDLDIYGAYQISDDDRKPSLSVVSNGMNDTELGDGDYRADAGETIHFYPTIKNYWGEAKNAKVSIEMGELEDETMIEFITQEVSLGFNLSSYATGKSSTPIVIKVNPDCVDGRIVKLRIRVTCDNISEDCVQDFEIKVENGVELTRHIKEDMTLYPNVHYIVTKGCYIAPNITLTIMPGTVIKIKDGAILNIDPQANIVCNGTPEQPIIFTKADLDQGTGTIWADPKNMYYDENGMTCYEFQCFKYTIFRNLTLYERFVLTCSNCIIEDNILQSLNIVNTIYTNVFYNQATGQLIDNYGNLNKSNIIENTNQNTGFVFQGNNTFSNYNTDNDIYLSAYYQGEELTDSIYLGTSSEEVAQNYVFDMFHPQAPSWLMAVFDWDYMAKEPISGTHGIVWKVLVNGYDAQDEYEMLPPLGVGKHKFEVYFNRPMNKAVTPMVAMGVRAPYTQNAIAEDGSWNEEGTIYTAYLTITGKTATDGVNRIYVAGAQDEDFFEIPVERQRFKVNVQVAGAMSAGFMAEAGLGRVHLSWDKSDVDIDDMLGYNMYRYTMIDNTQASDTICVNKRLIDAEATAFTDKDVKPGETYYYYYTILTTSMSESIPSRVVSATPLTVTKGDANGSTTVDYEDILAEVAYMTNQNPQPFVIEAADVNADDVVNIFDIILTSNIANNISITTPANSKAKYMIEDGVLYVNSAVSLAGVQLLLNLPKGTKVTLHENISGFEIAIDEREDGCLVLIYSMTGKTISTGKQALLNVGNAEVEDILLGDASGQKVIAIKGDNSSLSSVMDAQMQLPYPTIFSDYLHIPYVIGKSEMCKVRIVISDLSGRAIHCYTATNAYGEYNYTWTTKGVNEGVYLVSLYIDDILTQTAKVICRK